MGATRFVPPGEWPGGLDYLVDQMRAGLDPEVIYRPSDFPTREPAVQYASIRLVRGTAYWIKTSVIPHDVYLAWPEWRRQGYHPEPVEGVHLSHELFRPE